MRTGPAARTSDPGSGAALTAPSAARRAALWRGRSTGSPVRLRTACATFTDSQEAGARLAFVVEDIDTATTYGKMVYTILLSVSEAFLENVKAGWVETKKRAIGRGAYASRTPWGYTRNADSTLSPHPERAPIVAEAFRLAAGDNLQAALAFLRHAAPERNWNATKVRRLLSQRVYLGEIHYGDLATRTSPPTKRSCPVRCSRPPTRCRTLGSHAETSRSRGCSRARPVAARWLVAVAVLASGLIAVRPRRAVTQATSARRAQRSPPT